MRIFAATVTLLLVAVGNAEDYGTDISFPIHYNKVSTNYAWLPHNLDASIPTPEEFSDMPIQMLGDRQSFYNDMIQGCIQKYPPGDGCLATEEERIDMNLRQPQSMNNYTSTGFKKIRAPDHVWKLVQDFWNENKNKEQVEDWPESNTYVNHWESQSYLLDIGNADLKGGGRTLHNAIHEAAKSTVEEWTGQKLTGSSIYGVRIYKTGSVLATHVDRLPLVSSAILCVDKDVDEPWPLEVIGHDGKAHNVTMEPGDMVLYESHSILHGRPFPLQGNYVANIFVHFEPVLDEDEYDENDLPPYMIPGSPWEADWRKENPKGYAPSNQVNFGTGSLPAHTAASDGNVVELTRILKEKEHLKDAEDENGWTPLTEGARAGHVDVVKLLHEHGANINHRTNDGIGGTPLYFAIEEHGKDHPVVDYLTNVGALNIAPDDEF